MSVALVRSKKWALHVVAGNAHRLGKVFKEVDLLCFT